MLFILTFSSESSCSSTQIQPMPVNQQQQQHRKCHPISRRPPILYTPAMHSAAHVMPQCHKRKPRTHPPLHLYNKQVNHDRALCRDHELLSLSIVKDNGKRGFLCVKHEHKSKIKLCTREHHAVDEQDELGYLYRTRKHCHASLRAMPCHARFLFPSNPCRPPGEDYKTRIILQFPSCLSQM